MTDLAAWRAHRSGMSTVDDLIGALALEQLSPTTFTGRSTLLPRQRVFGGQLLAQCVVAAALTVAPPAVPHSLHAYFVRQGRPAVKLHFAVTTVRDGRSFAVRKVDALQDDEVVATMILSFHTPEGGLSHQDPAPDRPAPTALSARTPFLLAPDGPGSKGAVELRSVPPEPGRPDTSLWLRVTAPLPDDPLLHRAMLVYLSDFGIVHGAFNTHGVPREEYQSASLDHGMWLHRDGRADEWLLYDTHSPSAEGARALGRAALFTADGLLLATAGQEMLVRRR